MKFSCEKSLLLSAIVAASRAVSAKSSIPALEGLLIEAGDRLMLTGYDLEIGIQTGLDAEISEKGSIVLNARIFSEIVRKLPDEPVLVSADDKMMVSISCGMSNFQILGTAAEDFPELPRVERLKSFRISRRSLREMINMTVFAVSTNENKPVHTGSLFEVSQNRLTMVAVDGYRMALCREDVQREENSEPLSFVVPGKALREAEKVAGDDESEVMLFLGGMHILFDFGDTVLISRLLEGEFLNYKSAIQKDCKARIKADVKSLIESVERVSLVISEKLKNPVRCVFENNVVKLSCTAAIGRSYDECETEGNGQQIEIGFNNRYLLDALKAVPDDEVNIELISGVSPCNILPLEGDRYLYMVLPVRLRPSDA